MNQSATSPADAGLMSLVLFVLTALSMPLAHADEVYMSTDADGVTSFTDYPVPGAETVDLEPVVVAAEQVLASQAMIDQQLAVAKALEESRLAREQAQTERLKALAAAQPQTIFYPVERQTGYWMYPGYRPGYRPGYPGYRPGHPGFRPPGMRPPGFRPPLPEHPMRPVPPDGPGSGDSLSKPMPPAR